MRGLEPAPCSSGSIRPLRPARCTYRLGCAIDLDTTARGNCLPLQSGEREQISNAAGRTSSSSPPKLTHGPQTRNSSRDDGHRLHSPQVRIEEDVVCARVDDKQGGLHVDMVGAGEEGGDLLVGRRDGDGRVWTGEALDQSV